MSKWTPARQQELITLAAEQLSASDIAARLNTTRNAVIGRSHRTGVKLTGQGNPLTIARSTAGVCASWRDPEKRMKRVSNMRKAWSDPEKRARQSVAIREGLRRKRAGE